MDLAIITTFDEGHLEGRCSSNHHFCWSKIPTFLGFPSSWWIDGWRKPKIQAKKSRLQVVHDGSSLFDGEIKSIVHKTWIHAELQLPSLAGVVELHIIGGRQATAEPLEITGTWG